MGERQEDPWRAFEREAAEFAQLEARVARLRGEAEAERVGVGFLSAGGGNVPLRTAGGVDYQGKEQKRDE